MVRIVIFIFGVFIFAASVDAQQRFRRTSFPVNSFIVNPAAAGTEPVTVFGSSYRNQWAGFEGAPTTSVFSVHSSFPNSIGGGLIVYSDDMGGAVTQTGVELTGAYKMSLPNRDAVSFGLSIQGTQFGFDSNNLEVWDPNDPSLTGMETTFGVDAAAGMMVYGVDYAFGVAVSNLFQDKLGLSGVEVNYNRDIRHYRFMGSYTYDATSKIAIQTSGMIRLTEVTPAQIDLYSRAVYSMYQVRYWGGAGIRIGDAITFSAGIEFANIGVSYSYDLTNANNLLGMHTHEVNVTYLLPHSRGFGAGSFGGKRILERSRLVK